MNDVIHFTLRIQWWSFTTNNFCARSNNVFNVSERNCFDINRPRSHSKRIHVAFVIVFISSENLQQNYSYNLLNHTSGAMNTGVPTWLDMRVFSEFLDSTKSDSFALTSSLFVENEARSRLSGFKSRWVNLFEWRNWTNKK